MEQFRHIGEVLGSLKALMLLQNENQINQRQCSLLFDIFSLAFNTVADEIGQNLKLEEKNIKWKALDQPLNELRRIFKEGEIYVRHCMDGKDWWGKAICFHQNKDCVEFHIHNLLCYFPAVIEAIETAGEISGLDQDEMQKKRFMLEKKYDMGWNDPKLFGWRFGKEYLLPREICSSIENAWREDRWMLVEALKEKKMTSLTKNEQRLGDLMIKKLIGSEKLFPSSVLVGGKDYHVRRRLSEGNHLKEIHWLGENFALRHFFGDIAPLSSEISNLLSLSHPNILQYFCGFYDEDVKECFLVMELMNKDLSSYIREICSPRRRVLFSLPIVVDLMLQIAKGMEYLHSKKFYHGDLNPSNILLKSRTSTEGLFHAKITGFGLSSVKIGPSKRASENIELNHFIWHAPEVLLEQENLGSKCNSKFAEKADVYSFGMICFELLTGKIPFEDSHLQGDKMSTNIRAGERPLFPFYSPKYLVNLTKRCWQTDPNSRPSFSSICRILRYVKKFLVMNPDHGQPELQFPPVDYLDIESWFQKKLSSFQNYDQTSVLQIPFQMFCYKLAENERTRLSMRDHNWELVSDAMSLKGGDPFLPARDVRSVFSETPYKKTVPASDMRSVCSEAPNNKILSMKKVSSSVTEITPVSKGRSNSCRDQDMNSSPMIISSSTPISLEAPEKKIKCTKISASDVRARKVKCEITKSTNTDNHNKKISQTDRSEFGDQKMPVGNDVISVRSEAPYKKISTLRKSSSVSIRKEPGTLKPQTPRSSQLNRSSRSTNMSRETRLHLVTIPRRRVAENFGDS